MKIGIIVTGLPASGKTSIARDIAKNISFDLLDKDDFLEGLYGLNEVRTRDDRKKLSRKSDILFQQAAEKSGSAVLVSHWKSRGEDNESGTPTNWLLKTYKSLVEVYCSCPPDVALNRFLTRKRHPGHLDQLRDPAELALQFSNLESKFPLGIGPVLEVRTDIEVSEPVIVDRLRLLLKDIHHCA